MMKEGGAIGLSGRDRWLLAVLPALAVLVGYVFVFERPRSNEVGAFQAQVEAAKRQAVSGETMRAEREELEQLRTKVAARRASTTAAAQAEKIKLAPRRWNSPAERPAALAALSRLLESHNVAAASTTRLVEAAGKSVTDPKLKNWLLQTGATDRDQQPETWKVELVGDYGRIMEVLEAMPGLDRVVVPWELSMEPAADGTPLRRWSLVFII
jgi:hypothetical protein